MRYLIASAALLVASPVSAQDRFDLVEAVPCQTQVVMDRLCVGMTKEDAQRAYMGRDGKSKFSRWENANEAQVSFGNTGRTISRIERWYDVDVNVLIAQMIAKYGEPTSRAMASDTAPMSLRGPRYGTAIQVEVLTWRVGQVVIEVRNPHNDYKTSGFATYTVIDAAKPLEI